MTVDSVTSLQPVYNGRRNGGSNFKSRWTVVELLTDKKKNKNDKQKRQKTRRTLPDILSPYSNVMLLAWHRGLLFTATVELSMPRS